MSTVRGTLARLLFTPSGLLALAGAVVVILGLTHVVSTIQGARVARNKTHGSKPPTLPYLIPLLGHLPEFMSDTLKFMERVTAQYGPSTPVQIRLLNRRMSILKGAQNVTTLFKNSRKLASERWLVQILINMFGVEPADMPFYMADDTGLGAQPNPNSTLANPEHRIFHLVYKSVHTGLSGPGLDALTSLLVARLATHISQRDDVQHDEWTEVPDVYVPFIRKIVFRASVESLYGSHIFELIPDLAEDFWAFDSHVPKLLKEMPRWLVPESYRARDKMKGHIRRWEDSAAEHYTPPADGRDDREWEEYFGSKLMRTRHEFFGNMPLSRSSVSGENLGLLWAANANIVPAVSWMLLEILQRPQLLAQVRDLIQPYVSWDSADPSQLKVDVPKLCSLPLLQSIYAEVLRLRSGSVISRIPNCEDLHIGPWNFNKDEPIIASSYHSGRDETVWNQGTAAEPHSVDEFWAERFIVDPNDARSGPVLTYTLNENDADGQQSPRFSLDGTAGSWLPFGGGARMCPGRHYAKAEMIVTTAIFLTAFDIELLTEGTSVKHDLSYFMFGVMHPEGKVPARIRRRGRA